MRIGILTSVHSALDTRIYFKQARSLRRLGHAVHLVARGGDPVPDVSFVPVHAPRSRWARIRTCLEILLEAVRLRCDVYHVHDPELLPIGVLAKWLTGACLVYDVHENVREQILIKYWIARVLRRSVSLLYDALERRCLPHVDHVVVAEALHSVFYPEARTTVVANYPIIAPVEPASRAYSGRPILVYCGNVARVRGAMEMVEALALLRDVCPRAELRVIGPSFPESFATELAARADALGLGGQVRLLGWLPFERALHEIAQCDIGLAVLHPTANYRLSPPTKMFEYMSLRMPVVVSDFPRWRDVVERADCGVVVDPLDPGAIARAIASLNARPDEALARGLRGRRAVVERYNWASEAAKLGAVYRSLAAGRSRQPAPGPSAEVEVGI